jgi:hypothetical protein
MSALDPQEWQETALFCRRNNMRVKLPQPEANNYSACIAMYRGADKSLA